jgi:Ca2+-binding EF-hand superfamily protein
MSWAPEPTRDRFNDIYSIQNDGLIDLDHVERRKIAKRELVRKRIANDLLLKGSIQQIFNTIDADGSGGVNIDELIRAFGKMNLSVMTKDAEDLMKAIDSDGDGQISFCEFETFMKTDLTSSKVNNFDAKIREKRREQQLSYSKDEALSCASSFGNKSDTVMQSAYNNMANGKPMPRARRTSFALGHDTRRESMYAESEVRKIKQREQVRKTLTSRLIQEGGLHKLFDAIDADKSGDLTVKELKRFLDMKGMSIMHQDSRALLESMDTDMNGKIDKQEFEAYFSEDHTAMQDRAEKNAIADALIHKNATPLPADALKTQSLSHMKPTALSMRRSVTQSGERQAIQRKESERRKSKLQQQERQIGALGLSPRTQSRRLVPCGTSAHPMPRSIGQGSDGKMYVGLDPFRPRSPRTGTGTSGNQHKHEYAQTSISIPMPCPAPRAGGLAAGLPPRISEIDTEDDDGTCGGRAVVTTPPSATFPLGRRHTVRPPHFGPFWPGSANFQRVQESRQQQETAAVISISPAGSARRRRHTTHSARPMAKFTASPPLGSACRILPPMRTRSTGGGWQSDLSVLNNFVQTAAHGNPDIQNWNAQENCALANLTKDRLLLLETGRRTSTRNPRVLKF